MPCHLRPVVPSDEPFLWEMLYHALFVPPGAAPLSRDLIRRPELARYVQGWGRSHDHGILAVATPSQEPIAAVWLRLGDEHDRGYGYVDVDTPELSLAVLPDHRGQGIGTRLLVELLRHADERYGAVCLSVSAENPATRLYQRTGFREVRRDGSSLILKRDRGASAL
jgi:ribosomal protein S18 acetylase RimI-like enzyme